MIFYSTQELQGLIGVVVKEKCVVGLISDNEGDSMSVEQIRMNIGEDKTVRVFIKDTYLNPIDITGAIAVLTIKDGSTVLISKSTAIIGQGEIGTGNKGELLFYITPSDTATIGASQYTYNVQVTFNSGKIYYPLSGTIQFDSI